MIRTASVRLFGSGSWMIRRGSVAASKVSLARCSLRRGSGRCGAGCTRHPRRATTGRLPRHALSHNARQEGSSSVAKDDRPIVSGQPGFGPGCWPFPRMPLMNAAACCASMPTGETPGFERKSGLRAPWPGMPGCDGVAARRSHHGEAHARRPHRRRVIPVSRRPRGRSPSRG